MTTSVRWRYGWLRDSGIPVEVAREARYWSERRISRLICGYYSGKLELDKIIERRLNEKQESAACAPEPEQSSDGANCIGDS